MVLYEHIAAVFRSYLIHGTLSNEIIACAFLPIWKGGVKPQDSFHSYRANAGASQLFKLLEYVILVLWGHHLSSDSLQFAYKQDASTSQATWLVTENANYYYQRGGMLHCAALDMTKAFDTILYSELFKKISAKLRKLSKTVYFVHKAVSQSKIQEGKPHLEFNFTTGTS